jgi:hypothetical protein
MEKPDSNTGTRPQRGLLFVLLLFTKSGQCLSGFTLKRGSTPSSTLSSTSFCYFQADTAPLQRQFYGFPLFGWTIDDRILRALESGLGAFNIDLIGAFG